MALVSVLGWILVLALSIDVTLTLFSPFGHHGGPVHRTQNRLLWSIVTAIGRVSGGRLRPKVLALAAPVGVLSTVLLWSAWLIGAFALIYIPHLDAFRTLRSASSPTWVDALYYSGYVATTLGLGDVIALSAPVRVLTIVEAVAGFTLFAISTTYALTIVREAGLAAALSSDIRAFRRAIQGAGQGEDGAALPTAAMCSLADRKAEAWAQSLLRITDAHRQYPLLHYVRPTQRDRSLIGQVGWIVAAVEGDAAPGLFDSISGRLLCQALEGYLNGLNEGCVPSTFSPLPAGSTSLAARHERLLLHLRYGSRTGPWR